MRKRIVKKVTTGILGFIMAIVICPCLNVLAATSFYGTIDYFLDGTKSGYFNGEYVTGSGGDIIFSIGGHGKYDELTVTASAKTVQIKNLVPDLEAGEGDLWFNPSMCFSDYTMNFSGENKLSAIIIGASAFTITMDEGGSLTVIGSASAPAIAGNGRVTIGPNTRLILTNASGETVLNAGEVLPTDVPLEQKQYTKAEFIHITDISKLKASATLSQTTFEFTGAELKPTVTIPGLVLDQDYTVTYSANTNVGTAKAVITGKGKYTGTFELEFTITPKAVQKDDVIKDEATQAEYKVTSTEGGTIEVEFTSSGASDSKTVTIPATVDVNGQAAKVTSVANNAFKGNKTVTNVTLGSNVEKVGNGAFQNCTKLKTVTIGKNVKTINKNAFNGCKSLKTIKIQSTSITKMQKNSLKGINKNATIKVPKKKLEAYTKLIRKSGAPAGVKVKK